MAQDTAGPGVHSWAPGRGWPCPCQPAAHTCGVSQESWRRTRPLGLCLRCLDQGQSGQPCPGEGQETSTAAPPAPPHKWSLCLHGKRCGGSQGPGTNPHMLSWRSRGGVTAGVAGPEGRGQIPSRSAPGEGGAGAWQGLAPPVSSQSSRAGPHGGHCSEAKQAARRFHSHPAARQPRCMHEPGDRAGDSPSLPAATVRSRRQSGTSGAHGLRGPRPRTAWRGG